jgi:hypothetical protein
MAANVHLFEDKKQVEKEISCRMSMRLGKEQWGRDDKLLFAYRQLS